MQLTAEAMQLSSLLDRFAEPETLKMAKLGRELRARGIDVIDLSLGEPDFDTPQHIKDAAKKAIDDNWSHYPPVAGYPDLRAAVCTKFKRDNDLDYKPENIVISTGAKQSLANIIFALVDEGDEVIIPAPFWVTRRQSLHCFKAIWWAGASAPVPGSRIRRHIASTSSASETSPPRSWESASRA